MDAAYPRRRLLAGGWPLLAVLGVHLLLVWSWRNGSPPAPDLGAERVIELVPVPPPPVALPRRPPEPPASRSAPHTAPSAPAGSPGTEAPDDAHTPDPPPAAPATPADPFAITTPGTAPPSPSDTLLGRARRDALAIDRELRKGKSGVPEVADTPIGRFRTALEGAYKDRGLAITTETYTAPDGQVIYRFRRGGRYRCRISGSVGPKIGGAVGGGEVLFDVAGGGGAAGEIRCPSHVEWKRD